MKILLILLMLFSAVPALASTAGVAQTVALQHHQVRDTACPDGEQSPGKVACCPLFCSPVLMTDPDAPSLACLADQMPRSWEAVEWSPAGSTRSLWRPPKA